MVEGKWLSYWTWPSNLLCAVCTVMRVLYPLAVHVHMHAHGWGCAGVHVYICVGVHMCMCEHVYVYMCVYLCGWLVVGAWCLEAWWLMLNGDYFIDHFKEEIFVLLAIQKRPDFIGCFKRKSILLVNCRIKFGGVLSETILRAALAAVWCSILWSILYLEGCLSRSTCRYWCGLNEGKLVWPI